MKTVRDDLTGKEHSEEENVSVAISFSSEGSYFKAMLDISPDTFMKVFGDKKVPFQKYFRHKTEAEKAEYNGRAGHYEPAKGAIAILAGMTSQEVKA